MMTPARRGVNARLLREHASLRGCRLFSASATRALSFSSTPPFCVFQS